uniref:Small integral membrane protein 20 n=1 Tax=Parastrongyloides trichosuri TaxID=131310 RepID=A0A0N4ZUW3_PARTI
MRIPDGVKAPFLLRMKSKFPVINSMTRPSLGSVAVFGVSLLTIVAVYEVVVQPKFNADYYKQSQMEKRALIHGSREDLAHGMRPWSDPFKPPK